MECVALSIAAEVADLPTAPMPPPCACGFLHRAGIRDNRTSRMPSQLPFPEDSLGRLEPEPESFNATLYWIALILCLAVVLMLFVPVMFAFAWRAQSPLYWRPVSIPTLMWVSTALLIFSSPAAERARYHLRHRHDDLHRRWLWVTLQLGLGFLVAQVLSWMVLIRQGNGIDGNPHSSFFYIFTGLHAAHLLLGLAGYGYLLYRFSTGWPVPWALLRQRTVTGIVTVYWHFLDVLWLALFATLLTAR